MSRRGLLGRMAFGALLPGLGALAVPAHGAEAVSAELATSAALLNAMFPHDALDAGFYREMAARYLDELATRPEALAAHRAGLGVLDGSYIAPFVQLPEVIQRSMVAKVDQEPFFTAFLMRGAELVYRDQRAWDLLGYEGSSVEYGGYLDRGFDDIDWLPAAGGTQ
ncbi:hypothetical protein I5E68_02820 [Novosphingobium sp. YJ-S2-02]|uniref:Gluconate 2-dehydrogenase subunit 3 family protein n=1 Tax=Novosphingobium aureum TaxID=2792964 RepID=A0A931HAA2_9SPHN|nr:hypothetical protein [Novosphingobium aureum]